MNPDVQATVACREWRIANELAQAAEDRLARVIEQNERVAGPPPTLQMLLDASRARRIASQRLDDAVHHLTNRP